MTTPHESALADPEFAALRDLSAKLGSDPALVQGPGGNTSLKRNGVMWIKASGTWLSQARERPIMVAVDLAPLRAAIDRGDPACESGVEFVVAGQDSTGLRPSIETTMHAALPQPVVLHVHCVETIAWAVRADAEVQLAHRLRGLNWCFVPYVRPGLPLTQLINRRRQVETVVVVLANHGLVVAGQTVAAAAAMLTEVSTRLRRPTHSAPDPDIAGLAMLAGGSIYRLPRMTSAHGVATDPQSLAIAQRGSLYPDHVVFLGPGVFVLRQNETVDAGLRRANQEGRGEPPLILAPGKGVLIRATAPPAVEAMVGCLSDVLSRLSDDEPIRVLSPEDEAALLNWDAERYRKTLARRPG